MFTHPSFGKYCLDCGAVIPKGEEGIHECDDNRRINYQIFKLRFSIVRFEEELGEFLESPAGKFESWYAERRRPKTKKAAGEDDLRRGRAQKRP